MPYQNARLSERSIQRTDHGCIQTRSSRNTSVSYTHLDVYKRQASSIILLKNGPSRFMQPGRPLWHLPKMCIRDRNELWKQPPDPVLEAEAKIVSVDNREWEGSPTELAQAIQTDMAVSYTHLDVYKRQGYSA